MRQNYPDPKNFHQGMNYFYGESPALECFEAAKAKGYTVKRPYEAQSCGVFYWCVMVG